jgi:hypothetical protein
LRTQAAEADKKQADELQMRGRGVFQLLFCIALALQIVTPAAGATGRLGASLFGCSVATTSQVKAADPASAPTAPHHGTADCQQCPPMTGAVPLPEIPQVAAVRLETPFSETRVADSRALFSFPVLNDGAPPRAPPSRV